MTLDDVLEEVRADLEERIKRQLFGLQGLVVRPFYNSMMPLHVEVSSTPQLFDLAFLEDGRVELKHGTGSNADLRIESDSQTFSSLFRSPSAKLFNELESQGKIRITSLTRKGKDVEAYIRRYLVG